MPHPKLRLWAHQTQFPLDSVWKTARLGRVRGRGWAQWVWQASMVNLCVPNSERNRGWYFLAKLDMERTDASQFGLKDDHTLRTFSWDFSNCYLLLFCFRGYHLNHGHYFTLSCSQSTRVQISLVLFLTNLSPKLSKMSNMSPWFSWTGGWTKLCCQKLCKCWQIQILTTSPSEQGTPRVVEWGAKTRAGEGLWVGDQCQIIRSKNLLVASFPKFNQDKFSVHMVFFFQNYYQRNKIILNSCPPIWTE